MTFLKKLGIDRYTRAFKTWIGNKFIAKGDLKTINGQSIEGEGDIETTIFTPESAGSTNRKTITESRVYRAFYNIQNDEFTINNGSEKKSVPLWHINKITALGEIVNINIEDEHSTLQSCTAKVTLLPTINIQFDYLDTHYTLTWVTDTQSWGVTKTPINTGSADWNAQEGEAGYIKNKPFEHNQTQYKKFDFDGTIGEFDAGFIDHYYYNNLHIIADNLEIDTNISDIIGNENAITVNGPVSVYVNDEHHLIIKCQSSFYAFKIIFSAYSNIKAIDNKYLPNTVLKTTPQTLSDEDKNQVKENLGISTPDWNAHEGEDGFIKNRTHYSDAPIEENTYVESGLALGDTREIYPYGYEYYKVTINGESKIIDFVGKGWPQYDFEKEEQNKYEYDLQFKSDVGLNVSFFENGGYERVIVVEYYPTYSNAPETIDVSITDYDVDFKQLDEKFIPNTIARKSELTELSAEVGKKVDANFVNNAIAEAIGEAIGEAIDGGY